MLTSRVERIRFFFLRDEKGKLAPPVASQQANSKEAIHGYEERMEGSKQACREERQAGRRIQCKAFCLATRAGRDPNTTGWLEMWRGEKGEKEKVSRVQ